MARSTHTITITGPHAHARVVDFAHLGAQLAAHERTLNVEDVEGVDHTDLTARQAVGICVFGVVVDPYGLNIHGEAIIPPGLDRDHPTITQYCEPGPDYEQPCTHDGGLNRFSVHAPTTTEVVIDTQRITGDPLLTVQWTWLAALNYLYPDLRITASEYSTGGSSVQHMLIPYEQFDDYGQFHTNHASDDASDHATNHAIDQLIGPGMIWRSEHTSVGSWQTTSYTNIDLAGAAGSVLAASGAAGYVTNDRYQATSEQLPTLRAHVPVATVTTNARYRTAFPNTPQREHHDYCD